MYDFVNCYQDNIVLITIFSNKLIVLILSVYFYKKKPQICGGFCPHSKILKVSNKTSQIPVKIVP